MNSPPTLPPLRPACKVTPPSSQLPHLGKLSNPSSETSLIQSPGGSVGGLTKRRAKGSLSPINHTYC